MLLSNVRTCHSYCSNIDDSYSCVSLPANSVLTNADPNTKAIFSNFPQKNPLCSPQKLRSVNFTDDYSAVEYQKLRNES
jgi:hypothetical protein